jgi:transcriptional regulator with XRE-family HTH domain
MAKKRSDAATKHPALRHIEDHGITRAEAAEMLGIPDKQAYLNLVLDRWRGTSKVYARLFHEVFGIPYEELFDIPVRLDAKTFKRQQNKQKQQKRGQK